jgi:2-dehydro-3-deoxyphosphogluconate aldolase/(4S)-4-hydroxy-2-oxoglutarate aldolase
MRDVGMLPLFYHPDVQVVIRVAQACNNGGASVFEFTNRGDGAHEVFRELMAWARDKAPDLIIGTGSIVEPGTAALYMQMGADFIVSPLMNEAMAKICNRRKVAWIPGCGSLSEISQAESLGAEVVKLFPAAQVGGPAFIKAVKAPCPWTSIMPTGGVAPEEENLQDWFASGAFCVGMGSKLITKEIIAAKDYKQLEKRIESACQMIRKIRAGLKS